MGFFSQDCHDCGHPILSPPATAKINRWMSEGVSVSRHGEFSAGTYDGYGNLGHNDYAIGEDSTVWHQACWKKAGKPLTYLGASRSSADQGWFFDDGAHDLPEPLEMPVGGNSR